MVVPQSRRGFLAQLRALAIPAVVPATALAEAEARPQAVFFRLYTGAWLRVTIRPPGDLPGEDESQGRHLDDGSLVTARDARLDEVPSILARPQPVPIQEVTTALGLHFKVWADEQDPSSCRLCPHTCVSGGLDGYPARMIREDYGIDLSRARAVCMASSTRLAREAAERR